MKDNVLDKIKELTQRAKERGSRNAIEVHLASGNDTALSQAIKTKEQADEFMQRLKALKA